jgi:hypothetical protein
VPAPAPPTRADRRRRIIEAGSLDALLDQPDGEAVLRAEAADPDADDRLITDDQVDYLLAVRQERRKAGPRLAAFFSTDDVIVVPGFMGSDLRDVTGPFGLIWIDPGLVLDGNQLSALRLGDFPPDPRDRDGDAPARVETDADPRVRIESRGSVPAIYDLLALDLEVRRYDVQVFPFDWRKDIERSATLLADRVRGRLGKKPRPLHLIAHSQGALVARRAVQLLGPEQARRLVNNLVLIGPANFGTFSAAFALAGTHESLMEVKKYGVRLPKDFEQTLQSFTGLYQLLPWDPARFANGFDPTVMEDAAYWQRGADAARLKYGVKWRKQVDTTFFADRTVVILGDRPTTGAVKFDGDKLVPAGDPVPGDGTVPDLCAMLPGVRTFRAAGADHMTLPMYRSVLAAVRAILRGESPRIDRVAFAAAAEPPKTEPARARADRAKALELGSVSPLAEPPRPPKPAKARPVPAAAAAARSEAADAAPAPRSAPAPPAPPCRRLRVFSFDPLLATNLDDLDIAEITVQVPWETDGRLGPGPVGEYVEVVDYDPASDSFYHPVDLSHPRLTAQDGLAPSESNPQFHQQMTYAVAMRTIAAFEQALGRVALWAPRLERDEDGKVVQRPTEERYVPRLRVYPHALREANAYYDPDRHAILFGYFPSQDQPGGETLPGGTVFTCQSFDIIAHETTHALLHGLHRYFLYPSNPDLLAFHEAFADAVALFQHFSHPEVVREQIARTRGDLRAGRLLGNLARQFGAALGDHRGALRKYVDTVPDPSLYATTDEPHDRGAILMAALFRAFLNIYDHRVKDLYRIATGGTGKLPDGDLHPDLVNRLATEAAKSAKHVLTMAVRALDYVPPVDLTFGEYLRALITADYDLVRDDDRGYRVSVIDAFRSWGLYPADVTVLDEAALIWHPPDAHNSDVLRRVVSGLRFNDWTLRADRRAVFLQMDENARAARSWLYENARDLGDEGRSLGLLVFGNHHQSIPRNSRGRPRFEVHSLRPCSRVGPDGQQRIDLVAVIVQRRAGYFDPADQAKVDGAKKPWAFTAKEAGELGRPLAPPPDFWFRGGSTLVIDPETGDIRYCVRKAIWTETDSRLARQRGFEQTGALPGPAATYFDTRGRNPFALLHTD